KPRRASVKAWEKAAHAGHVAAVLVAKACDQVVLLDARASGEDQEHRRRGERDEPRAKRKAEACAEVENPRVHRVPHVPVRAVINKMRIPARHHRVGEISAKGDEHPAQPGDAQKESSDTKSAYP